MAKDDRQRDRQSFRDLAKLASLPELAPPPSQRTLPDLELDEEDSACIRLSEPPREEMRASSTMRAVALSEPPPAPRRRPWAAVAFAALGALVGASAVGIVLLRDNIQAMFSLPRGSQEVAVASSPIVEPPRMRLPMAEPTAAVPEPEAAEKPTAAHEAKREADRERAHQARAAKVEKDQERVEEATPTPAKPEPRPPAVPGKLGAALEEAIAKNDNGAKTEAPASEASGAAQPSAGAAQPSAGAVRGALGPLVQTARECLGPDDPASKATVTFASSGAVESVSLSGGAEAKPAGECIRGALAKAKVPPFANPTYRATVTVRPN